MSTENVVQEVVINAPTNKVWQAITNKNHMKNWYFDIEVFEPVVGFEFSFYGGDECQKYLHLCKITKVIENKVLAYTWRYDEYEGNSEVTFELFADGDKTRLKLTHTGIDSFPKTSPNFTRESFAAGWKELIGTLIKEYLEKQEQG
jgi:uncharacterized protein YndB with AHSA1/START domain